MYPEKTSKDIAAMELETRPPPPVVEETVDPVKEEARRRPCHPTWFPTPRRPGSRPRRSERFLSAACAPQDVDDMFSIWDEDGSGTLDKEEFKEMLRKLGADPRTQKETQSHSVIAASPMRAAPPACRTRCCEEAQGLTARTDGRIPLFITIQG